MSQGWQKHFSFGKAKYSAGVMHLCEGCKAADYLCKAPKILAVYSPKHTLVRESEGSYPLPLKILILGYLWAHLLAIHISLSQSTN